ncbi:MAG: hypothetical protein ACRYFS_19970 [Janthinobacterium lividum]
MSSRIEPSVQHQVIPSVMAESDSRFIERLAQAALEKLDELDLVDCIFDRVRALQVERSEWSEFVSSPHTSLLPENPKDLPLHLRVLSDENYLPKLCFTSSLDTKFIPGAVGLIQSIRKFYDSHEADIVLFIDRPSEAFRRFCEMNSVDLHLFEEIEGWAYPLVYDDPRYANDCSHFYHPDFELKPGLEHHLDRETGLRSIRHLHPLNVKAYCTGYCLCVKNYRHVIHIDCDAFILARVDEIFARYDEPGTVIAFDDGAEELKNFEALFDTPKPVDFRDTDYAFNAGIVFYVNNRAIKQLARDFMFFVESCYHFKYAGHFADQGVLRALVAKYHILGDIIFYKEDAVHWNPTWFRADELVFDPETDSWYNSADGGRQYIWHGAGGEKVWTGKYKAQAVNAAWKWIDGPSGDDWIKSLPDAPGYYYYERVMNNDEYVQKLCFTSCLNAKYRLGAMGLVSSIRKFYSPEEADIVLFIDEDFEDFAEFCMQQHVELRYFHEIDGWVQPLVYEDPLYAGDSSHFYHPDFVPSLRHPHHKDRVAGFGKLQHLHPLNVKAYCTGYCLCVKNYLRVVHIDCDAFLLARVDEMFDKHSALNNIIGFEDDEDELVNLESVLGVKKPDTFRKDQFGFNAGIVFYVNGPGTKAMIRDFMFFTESCYHYQYAGSYSDGDQGLIRAVVAKHDILGHIHFHREDNVNWNPTWKRCEELVFDASAQSWINLWNGKKQHIWHNPMFGGFLGNRLWTRRYPSASVNEAWRWVGGGYENWQDIPGVPTDDLCEAIAVEVTSHIALSVDRSMNILELGSGTGRTAVAWASLLREQGIEVHIDTCDDLGMVTDKSQAKETIQDNIQRFHLLGQLSFHEIKSTENIAARFHDQRYDFVFMNMSTNYQQALVKGILARKLTKSLSIIVGLISDVPEVEEATQDAFGSDVNYSLPGLWIVHRNPINIHSREAGL